MTSSFLNGHFWNLIVMHYKNPSKTQLAADNR